MVQDPLFKNPPIQEALLDIRVALPSETTLEHLQAFYNDSVKLEFPVQKRRERMQGELSFDAEGQMAILPPSRETDGYIYISEEKQKMVQVRRDGFTFNKLQPYQGWESMRDEAQSLWAIYKEVTNPVNVVRVALRYINRIEIPFPIGSLNDYFISMPPISKGSVLNLNENFFLRFQVESECKELEGIVTQTIELHNPEGPFLPFVFDIDVFSSQTFKPDSEEIWSTFEKLRNYKNALFLNSITEATKELFK